ncbi:DUF948 domain-containing protein [Oceanobacillus sp. J11TS1]|uniref:DUF948 domain-containing protein n=1 Tax=Oceanobacillus sp. J11TS1 TaxID=2807191 RepID=UPI001B2D12BC|nr:DUF948 domain-containing protein [Oceanobacillus sp. J11TS1]GIO24450.1 hypothetical protein J11TS1_30310 [Oceanobacillus sp. J11TS1]
MEVILYSALAIAIIALLILIIYLVILLVNTKKTMDQVLETLGRINHQVKDVAADANQVVDRSKGLVDDLTQKSSQLDGLILGAKGIGDTVEDFNKSLQQLSNIISKHSKEDQEKAAQAVKWGASIFEYWNRRKTNSN